MASQQQQQHRLADTEPDAMLQSPSASTASEGSSASSSSSAAASRPSDPPRAAGAGAGATTASSGSARHHHLNPQSAAGTDTGAGAGLHLANSSSTLFNSALGSPPVYQQDNEPPYILNPAAAQQQQHQQQGIMSTAGSRHAASSMGPASSSRSTASSAQQQQQQQLLQQSSKPYHTTGDEKAALYYTNSRDEQVVHYQPHTQAPRIALTDPLADMRARNLSRPHGLGRNSDWPDHRFPATAPHSAAATDSPISPPSQHGSQPQHQSSYPVRPGFSRQTSEMSLSASELEHNYGDDDNDKDPDDYAWSDEDDVEEAARFEEEQAKELRVGGRGRLSLWKILRFLATTFLGNFIISCTLIVPVLVMQFYYRKHLPDYVASDSPEANARRNRQDFIADNVQAAFIWAAFNLHMMWWLHIGVELFPRVVLFIVRGVWGTASQRLLGLAEFYASIKQFIKPVFYAAMSWGSWAIIYGPNLYDLYNNSDTKASRATYAPRLYQVVEFFFFFILTVCVEKILIKFIAMKFHTTAYAERLAKVAQALQVFDVLRDYRTKPAPLAGGNGSRPGTPGLSSKFSSAFGLPKGFGGPPQGVPKSGSGRSTPMRMEPNAVAAADGSGSSSADHTMSKRKHAERRPAYFAVEGDLGADGMADDEGSAALDAQRTLVDRKGQADGSQPAYARKKKSNLTLHNLFHPSSRRSTVEDPDTGIELDAQTGMPLRNRSNFEGTEGMTPAGSGYKNRGAQSRSTTGTGSDQAHAKQGRGNQESPQPPLRRRARARQRVLTTAAQARAIARVAMNDPFALLSSNQLLGGVGVDVTGPAEAKRLARSIFKRFRGTHRRRYLVEADFEPAFDNKEAAKKAFAVFDRDGNGDISQTEIKNTVLAVYKERRFLSRSVQDVHHAVSTLDTVILTLAMIIILFEALAIFNVNISKMVTTVYTLGLAFAFIFKQTASNVFDSIVFLFVTHAYDTGDRIMIGDQVMVVKRMSLLSTQFTLADGTVIVKSPSQDMYVSNALLGTLMITNFRRSGYQWESVPLQFPFDTPLAKLDAIEEDMKHWLATEPERMFEPSTSIVPQHMDNMRSISCTVGMTHRANWQDWGARFARRNAFYAALSYYCKKHGVRYATSLQPVVYWEEDDTGMPPSYTDTDGVDPHNKRVWVPDEANDDFAPSPPPSPLPGASGEASTRGAAAAVPGKPKCYMGFTPPPDEIEGSGLRMRKARRSEKALAGQGGD
ncbi:hypothetical protein OC842_004440 [Tilletia horrida]|uniref:EF-hand domain-containing protein n=1 Tax=Tilletia horrida TaxID=155126 RepID=A0AAN6GC71_9BASI|nr:hypothetical protein OC842_004440 [Tilletia horrida]